MATQLAGPRNSETAIVSLAAQIETARPWRDRRPELTSQQDAC
jgi:Asp-tRNA(Asn)/Glu-tRNA(Gln) amidotransferase A subunit family amidase